MESNVTLCYGLSRTAFIRDLMARKYSTQATIFFINLIFLQTEKRPQLIDFSGEHPGQARRTHTACGS